jgi:hypothetical protein
VSVLFICLPGPFLVLRHGMKLYPLC